MRGSHELLFHCLIRNNKNTKNFQTLSPHRKLGHAPLLNDFPRNSFNIWGPDLLFFSCFVTRDLWTDSLCWVMTEHDRLLNRVLNAASRPALREENGDKVLSTWAKKKKKKQTKATALHVHGSSSVCLFVCSLGDRVNQSHESSRSVPWQTWWMLSHTWSMCPWWTACSGAPSVSRSTGTSLFVLCLRFTQN